MGVNGVLEAIGRPTKRQELYMLLTGAQHTILAMQMVFLIIAGADMPIECASQDQLLSSSGNNTTTVGPAGSACGLIRDGLCDDYEFAPSKLHSMYSIVKEWNLVCDRSLLVGFSQSLYMFGVLVGAVVFGFMSDRFGRKRMMVHVSIFSLLTSFLTTVSWNYTSFTIFRFLNGFGTSGVGLVSYVLGSELIANNFRAKYSAISSVCFALGVCLLGLLGYILPNWRHFAIGVTLVSLPIACTVLKFPESPYWLASKTRLEECVSVLQKLAKGTDVDVRKTFTSDQYESSSDSKAPIKRSLSESSVLTSILTHKRLLMWTLIQIYSFMCNSCVYYGLTMAAGSLSSNLYLSVVLSGLVELPGYALVWLFVSRCGRKRILCPSLIFSGMACLLILVTKAPALIHVRVGLALVGKLGVSISFCMISTLSQEIFPTVIRNFGLGICSMAARIGGILAPAIAVVGKRVALVEFAIFGFFGLSAGLLNLLLPETFCKELPETVADLDRIFLPEHHDRQKKQPGLHTEDDDAMDNVPLLEEQPSIEEEFEMVY